MSLLDQRLPYRPAVVDLFRGIVDPEVQRVAADIKAWQDQINALQGKISDASRYIAELRQAQKDIESGADLPIVPEPRLTITCRTCGAPIVKHQDGRWVHAGRELLDHGHKCSPDDKNSPVAEPAKGPAKAFGDWAGAIDQDRAEGVRS